MGSAFKGMDFNNYVSSPSASPNNTIFSRGLSIDGTSDSSSPSSPVSATRIYVGFETHDYQHTSQSAFNKSMPFDAYQYSTTPAHFYPAHESNAKIPVTLVSSTLDDKDRRRKRSDASKNSDKESVPSMHLVCDTFSGKKPDADNTTAQESTKPCITESSTLR